MTTQTTTTTATVSHYNVGRYVGDLNAVFNVATLEEARKIAAEFQQECADGWADSKNRADIYIERVWVDAEGEITTHPETGEWDWVVLS